MDVRVEVAVPVEARVEPRRRGLIGNLLVVVVVVGAIAGLVCAGAPAVFVPLPSALEPLRDHLLAVCVLLAEAVVIVLALIPGWLARGEDDDFLEEEVAIPRGWTVRRVGTTGRVAEGDHQGRQVALHTATGRHSPFANPGVLRIYVEVIAGRRVHITTATRTNLTADLTLGLNLTRLPDQPDLSALSLDAPSARTWLDRPEVVAAARRLLASSPDPVTIIKVEPDAVGFHIAGPAAHAWTPELLDLWLEDLCALADGLDAIGPPSPAEAAWGPETTVHHHPEVQGRRAWMTCLGCTGCFGLVLIGSAIAVLLGVSLG
jgi:hypothetical protein